jgi:hypothetical protein
VSVRLEAGRRTATVAASTHTRGSDDVKARIPEEHSALPGDNCGRSSGFGCYRLVVVWTRHRLARHERAGLGEMGAVARSDQHPAPRQFLPFGAQSVLVLGVRNPGRAGVRAFEICGNRHIACAGFLTRRLLADLWRCRFVRSGIWTLGNEDALAAYEHAAAMPDSTSEFKETAQQMKEFWTRRKEKR